MPEQASKTELGNIKIHSEVISAIASLAAIEVPGVRRMGGGAPAGLRELLWKSETSRGVKVEFHDEEVKINVAVIVNYGVDIPRVATAVQANIKKAIESMTGLNIVDVDVSVEGVDLPAEKGRKEGGEGK